ncbi:MAG: type II secretory pathway component [Gammaproteobacteria bacterium]|nr:MAG: type II secretory pathway component [Gammaproteobacteria bacterium]
MCRSFYSRNKASQSGSALVIAIFVLVIMTLLGSALIRMQSSSAESVVYEVMGTRAYAAAQTGLQWQLTEVFPLNTTGITLCKRNNNGDIEINEPTISGIEGLENCEFNITCDDRIEHDGVQYYTLTSIGSCQVAGINTSRTIEIEARNIN